jgi:hypothetical protein
VAELRASSYTHDVLVYYLLAMNLEPMSFWQLFLNNPEWALVGVGTLTLFVIWRQAVATTNSARATKDAAKATQDSVAAIQQQVGLMERQTKATEKAANATNANADALIASERAWILVDIGKLPPFRPDPNQLQILWIFPTIKNYGKTVARITRVAGIVKLIPEGKKLPVEPEYILGQGFDEQTDTVLPPDVPMQPRLAVSGDEFIQVQAGKLSLFVHGFIEYFDGVSEKQRRSAYCFGYVIQGGYSPAETGFYPYLAAPRGYTECT